jgi:hypothetical protein
MVFRIFVRTFTILSTGIFIISNILLVGMLFYVGIITIENDANLLNSRLINMLAVIALLISLPGYLLTCVQLIKNKKEKEITLTGRCPNCFKESRIKYKQK